MIKKIAFALATLALAAGAHAGTTVYSADFSGSGELDTSVPVQASFSSAASGAGELAFALNGFGSLDGANSYMDIFTLTVNGTALFSGTFNLGGGGSDVVFTTTSGLTWSHGTTATGASGTIDFTVPVSLTGASEVIDFSIASPTSYTAPDGTKYENLAGHQYTNDEGWSIGKVAVSAVPEPTSVALMLAGLGMIGGLARRRRQG
jgi:hypothetical protein